MVHIDAQTYDIWFILGLSSSFSCFKNMVYTCVHVYMCVCDTHIRIWCMCVYVCVCETHTCVHICDTHTRVHTGVGNELRPTEDRQNIFICKIFFHTGVGNELRATEGTRCSSERCHSQQGGALQGAFIYVYIFFC